MTSRSHRYRTADFMIIPLIAVISLQLFPMTRSGKCLCAEVAESIQIDPTIYQIFGDLHSKEDYEGILREADKIIDDQSATDAAREYAFFMKIIALQSLERYVEAIGEADRCLQLFPSGTYAETIKTSRSTSITLIGVYTLVDIRSEYANDSYDRAIVKIDQYLQSQYVSESGREEVEKIRIVALARLDRTDEAAEAANRFLATYPESEFLSEVEEIQEEAARVMEIEARVLESSEFVLAYREALRYESIMPASVSTESGGISDSAVAAILLDHADPRYSDSWSSDAVEEINLNIELEADQKQGSRAVPRYLGLQTPGPGGGDNRGEVNFELFASDKSGERKLGDFHLDQGESGIQCFALESDSKPTGLRIRFYNDDRDIRYYSLSNLYLLGEDRSQVIAERDDANMFRTSIPEFEIGERVIPVTSEVFPVHRTLARVNREDISKLRYMFGNLLIGITDEENILIVDATTGEIETEITTSFYEVLDIIPDRRGRRVYFRYVDEERNRRFCRLNPSSWRIIYDLGLPQEPEPHSIYFAGDTGEALVVYPDDIELRRAGLGEVVWRVSFGLIARSGRGITAAFSSDGDQVAVGVSDGRLLLLDRSSGRTIHELPGFSGYNNSIMQVLYLHNDEVLLTASQVEIAVFSVLSGRLIMRTQTILRDIYFAEIAEIEEESGGNRILVGSSTGVYIVDIKKGTVVRGIARKWDQVAIDRGTIYVTDDGYLKAIHSSSRHEYAGEAGSAISTGFYYNDVDELWVFCKGNFTLQIGTTRLICSNSFIFDDWVQWTTSYLRPSSGEILIASEESVDVSIVGGRTRDEFSERLESGIESGRVFILRDNTTISYEHILPEYDYDEAIIEDVVYTGSTVRKLNIVLIGEGFTAEELGELGRFPGYVNKVTNAFQTTFPFSMFRDDINVFAVHMPSKESGADDGPDRDTRNTAFNATYYGRPGIERLLIVQNEDAVSQVLEKIEAFDLVGVIVNDERHGGAGEIRVGGYLFTMSAGELVGEIALHEAGHTLGLLADEYEDAGVAAGVEFVTDYPNVQEGSDINFNDLDSTLKWKRFYGIPETGGRVGAYEGGLYLSTGIYRPQEECKMRAIGVEFCAVCSYELYRILCRKTGRQENLSEFLEAMKEVWGIG